MRLVSLTVVPNKVTCFDILPDKEESSWNQSSERVMLHNRENGLPIDHQENAVVQVEETRVLCMKFSPRS